MFDYNVKYGDTAVTLYVSDVQALRLEDDFVFSHNGWEIHGEGRTSLDIPNRRIIINKLRRNSTTRTCSVPDRYPGGVPAAAQDIKAALKTMELALAYGFKSDEREEKYDPAILLECVKARSIPKFVEADLKQMEARLLGHMHAGPSLKVDVDKLAIEDMSKFIHGVPLCSSTTARYGKFPTLNNEEKKMVSKMSIEVVRKNLTLSLFEVKRLIDVCNEEGKTDYERVGVQLLSGKTPENAPQIDIVPASEVEKLEIRFNEVDKLLSCIAGTECDPADFDTTLLHPDKVFAQKVAKRRITITG